MTVVNRKKKIADFYNSRSDFFQRISEIFLLSANKINRSKKSRYGKERFKDKQLCIHQKKNSKY